jgi:hypothetical protein
MQVYMCDIYGAVENVDSVEAVKHRILEFIDTPPETLTCV